MKYASDISDDDELIEELDDLATSLAEDFEPGEPSFHIRERLEAEGMHSSVEEVLGGYGYCTSGADSAVGAGFEWLVDRVKELADQAEEEEDA